ncbi:MAG: WD40/YVTN/BNR-like repeat-containing protein, partial [Planctomycetota bacterium]
MIDGLVEGGEAQEVFSAEGIVRVAESDGLVVAALGDGTIVLIRGDDQETISTGISEPIESLLILDEARPTVLIGTEAPHIYLLDGGSVRHNESFADLPCRSGFHTPWGGPAAVRSLAATAEGYVYADIHVGSIMVSADCGRTWQPVTPELHEDVHQVATSPAAPNRVYANTADSVWISDDRGESWAHRGDDLANRYGRCITVCPTDGDVVLATVSDGPHGQNVHGELWRTDNVGKTWQHVTDGFPASTADNINTYHVAFETADRAWAC